MCTMELITYFNVAVLNLAVKRYHTSTLVMQDLVTQ